MLKPDITMSSKTRITVFSVYIVLIVFGTVTGYVLSAKNGFSLPKGSAPKTIKTDTVVGIADEKTFKDTAEGVIEKDGVDGEGTHRLIREGGPSQTAFLISSVIDLDTYVGKKVKIWGQTMAAKKANWLMDVGKIEILEK
ncbi:hypothetical protein KKB64_02970 [Patescibacteria group bacterium]|nr:hypothetical protein [Patescibacteria group bacterium]MBU1472720.1 hypothetical protein [Patescibacteria group bacterium]MBU2459987.1 hypothetical protein [Patescibacteria group bacterium]MBU2544355.1 hypothetical protein [Patescibacteria group bacterium]